MIPLSRSAATSLIGLFIVWVFFVVQSGLGWNPLGVNWDFTNPGAFGDSFGPLSALMASIAAVSAIATYRAQSAELIRVVDREQESDKAARKSAFEKTFFQLLEHHRNNVASIDIDGSGPQRVGQDAFRSMVYVFRNNQSIGWDNSWKLTYEKYNNDLAHYFRFLYHLVKFVDDQEIEGKYFYIQILRATLSESELILLAANCAYGEGREKFKSLIEAYSLLHNMSVDSKSFFSFPKVFSAQAFDRSDG